MSNDDVRYAAVNDPAGERFVEAPATHAGMTQLRRRAEALGEQFYCATQLGGCGGRMHTVNGSKKRPYFRHNVKSDCTLDQAVARDIFTHVAIQNALVGWLRRTGHPDARKEKWVGPCSRVDVQCAPNAVIEVQLSGETDVSMEDRTERYGGNVTWLFDPERPISSRDSALARGDVVLLVRLRRAPDGQVIAGQVDVGIRTAQIANHASGDLWVPLEECTFTPAGGLGHPGRGEAEQLVATAKKLHQDAVDAARKAAEQAQAEQAAEAEKQRQNAYERMTGDADSRHRGHDRFIRESRPAAPRPPSAPAKGRTRPSAKNRPTARTGWYPIVWSLDDLTDWQDRHNLPLFADGAWCRVLRYHRDLFPDWAYSISDRWATDVPEHLIDPAWATLYLLATSAGGQVQVFVDQEVDPGGMILQRLESLGLVSFYGDEPYPLMVRVEQRVVSDRSDTSHSTWNAH